MKLDELLIGRKYNGGSPINFMTKRKFRPFSIIKISIKSSTQLKITNSRHHIRKVSIGMLREPGNLIIIIFKDYPNDN